MFKWRYFDLFILSFLDQIAYHRFIYKKISVFDLSNQFYYLYKKNFLVSKKYIYYINYNVFFMILSISSFLFISKKILE